ncbi:putative NAD(P)/FAD-binding protein YdhS [Aliiruegeria haliotis]|uniref:Putative NAD(P)/FAD-binding protein YdhS n=1 Tax=Aliiruegeria haliotis TaxID=1280846 RepID=A0A2T0RLT8_9RHOB|nr:FAD/NAD(P)-binding domain-containing protein [Aliiruegeria haliotis]PRY22138.1 putative NAD(P)/FAD-binding protein YdhS [Aliiruegeria haliotis]
MRLAIVGFGPRGLGALEALLRHGHGPISVDVFEPDPHPGAGPNFSPEEDPRCLLNLPLRDVKLPDPPNVSFPQFQEWVQEHDQNRFLPRAHLGAYLSARFSAVREALPDTFRLRILPHFVTYAGKGDDGAWVLNAGDKSFGPYDEVLLSLGQPDTIPDEQIARWRAHADRHRLPFLAAYPTEAVVAAAENWTDSVVGIRGLGLSTLDMISVLTLGRGGHMHAGRYIPSGREPATILPFSLDGMAPAPKPETAELAARFALDASEKETFRRLLAEALALDPDASVRHLAQTLLQPVARICGSDASEWIDTELINPGTQRGEDPVAALRRDIAIAAGDEPPSVGYTVGQIWRGWQPDLRRVLRNTPARADTRMAIVGFDTGLKRYSYGPPVEDARLLLALIEQGLVRLTVANDPDIELVPEGWRLDGRRTAGVMIDAVLPSAAFSSLDSKLIRGLAGRGAVRALADTAGVETVSDGQVVAADGITTRGMSMLGRLTEGSVIAADSIHDCFGMVADQWAKGMFERAVKPVSR